jgi:hypothetical protein
MRGYKVSDAARKEEKKKIKLDILKRRYLQHEKPPKIKFSGATAL